MNERTIERFPWVGDLTDEDRKKLIEDLDKVCSKNNITDRALDEITQILEHWRCTSELNVHPEFAEELKRRIYDPASEFEPFPTR